MRFLTGLLVGATVTVVIRRYVGAFLWWLFGNGKA